MIDKKTGRRSKKPPMFVKKGQVVVVRIETTGPICLETYESYQQLGRFTLRDEGKPFSCHYLTIIQPLFTLHFFSQVKPLQWAKSQN